MEWSLLVRCRKGQKITSRLWPTLSLLSKSSLGRYPIDVLETNHQQWKSKGWGSPQMVISTSLCSSKAAQRWPKASQRLPGSSQKPILEDILATQLQWRNRCVSGGRGPIRTRVYHLMRTSDTCHFQIFLWSDKRFRVVGYQRKMLQQLKRWLPSQSRFTAPQFHLGRWSRNACLNQRRLNLSMMVPTRIATCRLPYNLVQSKDKISQKWWKRCNFQSQRNLYTGYDLKGRPWTIIRQQLLARLSMPLNMKKAIWSWCNRTSISLHKISEQLFLMQPWQPWLRELF